jgi:hypothetical protein
MFNFKENNLWACPERKDNKLVLALIECGFQGNSINSCLWTKYKEHGIVFVGI